MVFIQERPRYSCAHKACAYQGKAKEASFIGSVAFA
jgi:hypothetical protein